MCTSLTVGVDKGLEIHSVKLRQIQLRIFEKYCTIAVVSQQVLVCGAVVVDKGGRDSSSSSRQASEPSTFPNGSVYALPVSQLLLPS